MFHQVELAINSKTSRVMPGVQVRLYDSGGAAVDIYADESGTPIETVSGVPNAAVSDGDGMYDFWVPDGIYDVRFYYGDALISTLGKIAFGANASIEIADQATAEAGADNVKPLSSLRTAQAIEAQVFTPLAGSSGGALVGIANGGTVQDVANSTDPSVWHRRPFGDVPLRYPDYAADLATVTGSYLYAQGLAFDGDGNIYLNIVNSPRTSTAIVVVFDHDRNYLGRFFRSSNQLSESIVIRGAASTGDLKLYCRGDDNSFFEHDLGTMPADGSTIAAGTVKIAAGCQSLFAYDNGLWLIEQDTTDLGYYQSRTVWNYYDDDFNLMGQCFIPKNVVGWKTDSDPLYPYVPKIQSVAMRQGKIYLGIGGSYIPDTFGPVPSLVSDFGIAELSADGTVLQYGVCDTLGAMSKVAALGYPIVRIEQEGLTVGPDGNLYSLMATQRSDPGDADTTGYLIFREMDMLAPSWADVPSKYKPCDLSRYDGKMWPRAIDGTMRNPVSGAQITTQVELLNLMTALGLHQVSYRSSNFPLTALAGLPAAGDSAQFDFYNTNNSTIMARVTNIVGLGPVRWWRISGGPVDSWVADPIPPGGPSLSLVDGVSEPSTSSGYARIYVDSADGDLKVKFGDGTVKTIVTDS